MKILLAGSGGQLGSEMQATVPADVTLVAPAEAQLDITDDAAIHAAFVAYKPDVIMNAAAYTAVDKSESDVEAAYLINEKCVRTLASAALQYNCRLVHISTDFVFDGSQNRAYAPEDVCAPLGVYGASKRAGELAVQAILPPPQSLIVRTAWVYSTHGNNFVKTMLRLMREKDQLSVVADQLGTPTYARNLAQKLWQLIRQQTYGTLHFTDEGVASWYDFAVAIQDEALALGLLDKSIPIKPVATSDYPTPAKRPNFSVLDKTAMHVALGATGQYWRHGLRDMLENLRGQM